MASLAQLGPQAASAGPESPSPAPCAWHEFDLTTQQWRQLVNPPPSGQINFIPDPRSLNLVTWNIDYSSAMPGPRMSAIISYILSLSPIPDVIFLQEVVKDALFVLLAEPRICQGWWLNSFRSGHLYSTITLLSKSRFQHAETFSERAMIGPVWRVDFPSRFGRDALCCDIFVPSTADLAPTRIRLINVHLDSLPIQPSFRPQQISTIAELLRTSGRGLVAGDFNPVLPEDDALVHETGLADAWVELRPEDPGFTWGVDGKQRFPPGRLDKVATIGMQAQDMEILHPGFVNRSTAASVERGQEESADNFIPWSDHSGLRCSFQL